jgi:hypothetical protein
LAVAVNLGQAVLHLRINGNVTWVHTLEIVIFVAHLVIVAFTVACIEGGDGVWSSADQSSNTTASQSRGQRSSELLELRLCVEKIAELGNLVAGEDAKDVPLVLRKFCIEVSDRTGDLRY